MDRGLRGAGLAKPAGSRVPPAAPARRNRRLETWQEDGERTATQRANRIWRQLLAEYVPPPLDPAAAEALDAFVDRRKGEIGRAPG